MLEACPNCGAPHPEKVSQVVLMAPGVNGGSGDAFTLSLAPPFAPVVFDPRRHIAFGCGLAMVAPFTLCLLGGLFEHVHSRSRDQDLVIFTIACLYLAFRFFQEKAKARQETSDEEIAEFQRQKVIWSRLFYCRQCDSVIDPKTGQTAPRRLKAVLY
jgi:hypothetical protein